MQHQRVGIRILTDSVAWGLLDEPGLGKTVQLLYAARDLMRGGKADCAVVVTRKAHARVWYREIEKHCPDATHYSVVGKGPTERKIHWPDGKEFYFINFELLPTMLYEQNGKRSYQQVTPHHPNIYQLRQRLRIAGPDAQNLYSLLQRKRCILIADESQYIKNPTAKTTKVAHGLAPFAKFRYISTGTLAAEKPEDVWAQIYFLDGGALLGPSHWAFCRDHCVYAESQGRRFIVSYKNLAVLRNKLSRITTRRLKTDCADLPPKTFKVDYLSPDSTHNRIIDHVRRGVLDSLAGVDDHASLSTLSHFASMFQYMLRVSAVPHMVDTSYRKPGVKVEYLYDVLAGADGAREPAVVWTVHRDVAERIKLMLEKRFGCEVHYIHGGINEKDRDVLVDKFQRGVFPWLVCTMASMREAYTLTRAQTCVYMERDFSLLNWTQSQNRVHRIGTTGTVVLHTPLVDGTLDEYVHDKLTQKAENVDRATDFGRVEIRRAEIMKALERSMR